MTELERSSLDAQFAALAEDHAYLALQLTLEREFAQSDWEAWQISEAITQDQ